MSVGLSALLGCVQSEVSQSNLSGAAEPYLRSLVHRVVLPTPPKGMQVLTVACKHCEQSVRVRVLNLSAIRRKRLLTRLALAAAVCSWVAAAALALLYFLDQYPAPPSQEAVLAGVLVALGVVLWAGMDAHDAFGGDVAIGCRIEQTPEEKQWARRLSPQARWALPKHVLLDPDQEFASPNLRGEIGRNLAEARRKPTASSTAGTSGTTERTASGSAV